MSQSVGSVRNAGPGKSFHFDSTFWDNPVKCGFLDLYQMGEICCEPGFRIAEHRQDVHEITYVITGHGYSRVDGVEVAMNEGDVMVNAAGHFHAIGAGESSLFRYAYLGFRFNDDASRGGFESLEAYYAGVPYHLSKDRNDLILPFMRAIDELYSGRAYSAALVRNYCEQIVVLATRDSIDCRESLPERRLHPGTVGPAVYEAIRYVEEHIETIPSIRDIARTLGYSYTYLSALFKKKTGTTLQRYIAYKKIERAAQMLRYGELTVSQVGEALNYESLSAFSRSFRGVMGISPSRYLQAERSESKRT